MTSERDDLTTNNVSALNSTSSTVTSAQEASELKLKQAEKQLLVRVRQTQNAIRRIDLLAAFFAFVTLALALLLFGVILDCWVVPNGLSTQGRLYYAIFWCVTSCTFFIYKLVPVFRNKINALYAAKTLEELWQDKHNFTINWLQLRQCEERNNQTSEIRKAVIQGVARQAAENASKQPEELKIDCSAAIRWGVAFTVVVAVIAAYLVFSPKNPFTGAGRIIAPLANIERPQALSFRSIDPGDAIVYQGDRLEVVAEIPGADPDKVEILYSSEDGRLVDIAIPMDSLGLSKFQATFPDDEEGFTENLVYRIVVSRGAQFESSSDEYKIEVRPQPMFRVEKTELTFPKYTGLTPQSFENQGDVRALEGTNVVVTARCNAELKRAVLFPDGKTTRAKEMTIDASNPQIASIAFDLTWAETPNSSEDVDAEREQDFTFYQLVSHDVDDQENRNRQDYEVSIVRDLPPSVRWTSTPASIDVPLNDVLNVRLTAEDEDFALRSVEIDFAYRATENGGGKTNAAPKPLVLSFPNQKKNVDYSDGPTPFIGPIQLSADVSPEKLGLEVGDELEYWCVAYDTKLPEPNIALSEKRILRVSEPVSDPQGVNTPNDDEEDQEQEEQNQNSGSGQNGSDEGDSANAEQNESGNNDSNNDASEEQEGSQGDSSDASSGEENSEDGAEEGEEGAATGTQNSNQGDDQEDQSNTGAGSNRDTESSQEASRSQESNSNGSSDSQTGGDNSTERSDEQGAGDGEPTGDPSDSSSAEPSANQSGENSTESSSPPSEAFEKILEHMNETGAGQPQDGDEQGDDINASAVSEVDEEGADTNKGTGNTSDDESVADSQNTAKEKEEEVDPDFQSDMDIPRSNEKRDLPTRTSSEKPKEDSPSYQANDPGKLDSNTRRREDDNVDPDGNNFLAQNASSDTSNEENPRGNTDSNITLDPQDQSDAVAGNAVDPNAAEAQGNSNNIPDGPFEVDDDPSETPKNNNRSGNTLDPGDFPEGLGGNGDSGSSDSDVAGNGSNSNGQGAGNDSQGGSTQDDAADSGPSNGNSDQNAKRQGGGGGSGLGELTSDGPTLAPADAPKLQYAEQATNLVLEYLEDSLKDEVDPELLQKLGWTEEQLREFLTQWQKMRKAAESGNVRSKNAYLKALEELRLEELTPDPSDDEFTPRTPKNLDANRGPRSAGEATRLKTPDRLNERVRAFTQGVSQGVNP